MASEELKATLELMHSQKGTGDPNPSIQEMRANMEQMQAGIELAEDVTTEAVSAGGVSAEWICAGDCGQSVILYFHGGGYVMGSLDTHRELCSRLSRCCRARVLSVDYRLAPEHVFPGAVEDGVASYCWLRDQGVDTTQIFIGGDSAGGGLTMAILLSLKNSNMTLPAGAILFSPWTDLAATGDSIKSRLDRDPMIEGAALSRIADSYAAGEDLQNPLLSPLYGDLTGLPPLLIQVGGAEILFDDASRLADNARTAGVDVELQVWEDAFHVFQAVPMLPEAAEALARVASFVGNR